MYENHGDEWEEKLKAEKEPAVQIIAEGTGDGTLTLEPRPLRGPAIVAPITTPHVAAASIPRTAPGSPGSGSLQSGSTRSSQLNPRALKNKASLTYEPMKHSLFEYYAKLAKYQLILQSLGDDILTDAEIEQLHVKAQILYEVLRSVKTLLAN